MISQSQSQSKVKTEHFQQQIERKDREQYFSNKACVKKTEMHAKQNEYTLYNAREAITVTDMRLTKGLRTVIQPDYPDQAGAEKGKKLLTLTKRCQPVAEVAPVPSEKLTSVMQRQEMEPEV